MTHSPSVALRVVGGVDTHKDVHVAAVLDELGRVLGTESFATTAAGYRELWQWMRAYGEVASVGVEGTAAWGAGLSRYLTAGGCRRARGDAHEPATPPPLRQVRRG